MAARKNMTQWLERWLDQHRMRRRPEEPPRGYAQAAPVDEEQVRQQALEGRKWIKEQQR